MNRRVISGLLGATFLAATLLAVLLYRGVYRPVGLVGQSVLFEVAAGESFSTVRDRLFAEGFIAHPRLVSAYAMIRRLDRRVQAGTYRLESGMPPRAILDQLSAGAIYRVDVTVREGLMVTEIAGVLAREAAVDSVAFAVLQTDEAFLSQAGVDGPVLEGYIFPNTYDIPYGAPAAFVATTMIEGMNRVFDARSRRRARELGLTRNDVVTLASIIEAETRLPEERALVSAVYHNRLQRSMRLEADPTVAYAKGGYRGRLYYKDLKIDSPYNTYIYAGLPPGPICSPGAASIHAALYPDTTCDALYFVAAGDGSHVFSRTLEDHNSAVRRARTARNRRGGR